MTKVWFEESAYLVYAPTNKKRLLMTTFRDIKSENVDMINDKSCEIPQAYTLDQTPIKKL